MYIISQQIMYFWYQTGHLRVTPSLRFETRLSLKLIFYSRAKKTYFHKKGLVLNLVLKQRLGVTQTTYLMSVSVWADHRVQVQQL